MAITTSIKVDITVRETSALDLTTGRADHVVSYSQDWTSGTGTGSADLVFSDSRSLAATSESIDLAGSLTSAFGSTLTFARIKAIYIENTHATATLAVGGAAANQFLNWVANSTDIVNVAPGGCLLLTAPYATGFAVTAATGDILKIDAGASTIVYKIVIIGCSA